MAPFAIDGDPEDLRVVFLKIFEHFIVKSHLVAANRAPVRRVKGENDLLAGQLAEPELLVRGSIQLEFGRLVSFFQHRNKFTCLYGRWQGVGSAYEFTACFGRRRKFPVGSLLLAILFLFL